MNETQYWNEVEILSGEIESAVAIFHPYEEISRLAGEDKEIRDVLNGEALFWRIQLYTLQTSLFIVLARIFDSGGDAHSIQRLLKTTLSNVDLFSKRALRERKKGGGQEPEWLDDYVVAAWAPGSGKDLRYLKKPLQEHKKRFEEVYRPIRNKIFAHKVVSDPKHVSVLFEKTSREEVAGILDFLHDFIDVIQNLYLNGRKPDLGQHSYGEQNQHIRSAAAGILRRLAKSRRA